MQFINLPRLNFQLKLHLQLCIRFFGHALNFAVAVYTQRIPGANCFFAGLRTVSFVQIFLADFQYSESLVQLIYRALQDVQIFVS